jgi:hypothetical protein
MHSSVRAEDPRLAGKQSFSNDSVHVSREVSVTSSRVQNLNRRASYSTMPRNHGEIKRPKVIADTRFPPEPILDKWGSKASAQSSNNYNRSNVHNSLDQREDSQEILDNNRESMRALAEFLMTRDPPPNHMMSTDSSGDEKGLRSLKKSAFKILRRKKKNKARPQRLIQLPDSAVSAKTSGGARYIAISIPIEHDHLHKKSQQPGPHVRLSSQRTGDRAVTVLKPVEEVRETNSSQHSGSRNKECMDESTTEIPKVVTTPPPKTKGKEDAVAFRTYQAQGNQHKRLSATEMGSIARRDPNRVQRSYIAVSPMEMYQHDIDPRHSGGTVYSTASILTGHPGHSRGPSTASTIRSVSGVSPMRVDVPPRNSSIVKRPKSQVIPEAVSHALDHNHYRGSRRISDSIPNTITEKTRGQSRVSAVASQIGIESTHARTSLGRVSTGSMLHPPVFASETAAKYGSADDGEDSRLPQGTISHATSRDSVRINRPQTAPPPQSRNVSHSNRNENDGITTYPLSHREGDETDARRERQDRVRARKKRDINESRPRSSGPMLQSNLRSDDESLASTNTTPRKSEVIMPPTPSPRRRKNSRELAKQREANTLSKVMLVISLPPYPCTTISLPAKLPSQSPTPKPKPTPTPSVTTLYHTPVHSMSRNNNRIVSYIHKKTNIDRAPTPPRSYASSRTTSDIDPDLDAYQPDCSPGADVSASAQSLRATLLDTRRQERRAKRNLSLREKELDDRMSKIERDNLVLLRTLSGIADSCGEMKRWSGVAARRKRARDSVGPLNPDEERRLKELDLMEPVMRELHGFAPRVSAESDRRRWSGYDEFDDDDGESIY